MQVGERILAVEVSGNELTIVTPSRLLYAVAGGGRSNVIEVCQFDPRATHAVVDTEADLVCISTNSTIKVLTRAGVPRCEETLPIATQGIRAATIT